MTDKKVAGKPSKEELKKLIDEKGYRYAGEQYGVSDNTARRWAMAYGIELKDKCVLRARKRVKLVEVDGAFLYPEVAQRRKEKAEAKKRVKVKEPKAKKPKRVKSNPERRPEPKARKEKETKLKAVVAAEDKTLDQAAKHHAKESAPPPMPVLRVAAVPDASGKNRYTPQECSEFRTLIMAKIQEEYESMCQLKDSLIKGGDSIGAAYGNAFDDGTAAAEREQMTELVAKKQKHLNALNAALGRTHNGTYGICVATGRLIPKERLLAVLHATKCLEAKNESDNGKLVSINASEGAGESEND